ncbi:hypothetical protein BX600DRAFT_443036 [Xylariales sp. PMI_506]|nr:hypothetical protein BX600DRAFT_443036 [Xylariales sp. PMI_506]
MADQTKETMEPIDVGKAPSVPCEDRAQSVQEGGVNRFNHGILGRMRRALAGTLEERGIEPVPLEERKTEAGFHFSLCGSLPTAPFSPWMGTIGPKTGLRQMVQTRYYFGFNLVNVIAILQLATLTGYTIITSIISGQTLTAISGGSLSLAVGIVLFLHYFEQYSWIPSLIAIIVTVGVGGKGLIQQTPVAEPRPQDVLTFLSLCASLAISWVAVVSDFSVYIIPDVSRRKTFIYVYAGYCIPSILLMILGAAIGAAVPNNSTWLDANTNYSVGGVMYAMVAPSGGFGKFIAVLLAFSAMGNTACSLYSLSLSLHVLF